MGLLDALIGNVLGSALGGNQRQDPLGSVLGGLAGGNQAQGGNLLLQVVLSLLQQNGGLDGCPRQVSSRRSGATSRFLGRHRPKYEHLSGSAATDIRLVDNERSGGAAWHAARAGRLDDGAGAAGAHQPADSPRSSAGEWRRGNRPGVSDAGQSRAAAPGVSREGTTSAILFSGLDRFLHRGV